MRGRIVDPHCNAPPWSTASSSSSSLSSSDNPLYSTYSLHQSEQPSQQLSHQQSQQLSQGSSQQQSQQFSQGQSQQQQQKSVSARPRSTCPGRRVIGGRLYDSELGVTCHWCRQKTVEDHVHCTLCSIAFCGGCLRNRHGELIGLEMASASDHRSWVCPKCRGGCGPGCLHCCNCGPCRKAQGLGPTGSLVRTARASGFSNVHDFLIAQRTNETPETIWERKKGKRWCQTGELDLSLTLDLPVPRAKANTCQKRLDIHSPDSGNEVPDVAGCKNNTNAMYEGTMSQGKVPTCRKRLSFQSPDNGGRAAKVARCKNNSSVADEKSINAKPQTQRKPRKGGCKPIPIGTEKLVKSTPSVANVEADAKSQHVLPVKEEKIEFTSTQINLRVVKEEKIEIPTIQSNPTSTVTSTSGLAWIHLPHDVKEEKCTVKEHSNRVHLTKVKEEPCEQSCPFPAQKSSGSMAASFAIAFSRDSSDAIWSKCSSDFDIWSNNEGEDNHGNGFSQEAGNGPVSPYPGLIYPKSEILPSKVHMFCPNDNYHERESAEGEVMLTVDAKKRFDQEPGSCNKERDKLVYDAKRNEFGNVEHHHLWKKDTFKSRLDAKLSEPFDSKELEMLGTLASHRKPIYRVRETRNSSVQVISNEEGNSYLDHYPELETCLESTSCPRSRLSFLRGFFFWLENASSVGAFKPWISAMPRSSSADNVDCIEIDGPDCEILAVVYCLDDDDDKLIGF